MKIFGVDFSSTPTKRKPIMVAQGEYLGQDQAGASPARNKKIVPHVPCKLVSLLAIYSLGEFEAWLQADQNPGPWLAAFDLPFALPTPFLQDARWPPFDDDGKNGSAVSVTARPWPAHMAHMATLTRPQMVTAFKAYCDARPPGQKVAHRACDIPAGSSPSMKWVNPPVAFMLHAGATAIFRAGLYVPALREDGDRTRIALEAYPGYFARQIVGRQSYKSDDLAKQTPEREAARKAIVSHLKDTGVNFARGLASTCIADASGDSLDACLCVVQAAIGYQRQLSNPASQFGMAPLDPLEGWIVSVPRGRSL